MDYPNPQEYYTKAEVDVMIAAAVAEAGAVKRPKAVAVIPVEVME